MVNRFKLFVNLNKGDLKQIIDIEGWHLFIELRYAYDSDSRAAGR